MTDASQNMYSECIAIGTQGNRCAYTSSTADMYTTRLLKDK